MPAEKPEKLSRYWVREEPNPIATKGIRGWVEEQIQEAMAQGKFSNLPGKGRPLQLRWEHPWEEQDWLCNHILSNAHVVPEWVTLEGEIRAELDWLRTHPDHPERAERIEALNRKIDRFNLLVPAGWKQLPRYRDDRDTETGQAAV
jgi:hypothetical protein